MVRLPGVAKMRGDEWRYTSSGVIGRRIVIGWLIVVILSHTTLASE